MTSFELGTKLIELIRAGKNNDAKDLYYAPDIVSVEAAAAPGQSREVTGIAACHAKGEYWRNSNEIHGAHVEGPFPNGDQFALYMRFDITPKATGKRTTMTEIALYTVKNDKIVREEYFYTAG